MRAIFALALCWLMSTTSYGQTPGTFIPGQQLNAAGLNAALGTKTDYPPANIGVSVGANIIGVCTTGFVLYNNNGVVGCEAGGGGSGITIGATAIGSGATNQLLYDNGGFAGEVTKGNNCVYATDGSGAPACATTLPSAVTASSLISVGTLTSLTVSGAVTTNITGGGTVCVQASNTGVLSAFSGGGCGGVSTSVQIGTTTVASGTDTRVVFQDGASPTGVLQENAGLTFSKATGLLRSTLFGIGGCTIGSNAFCVTGTAAVSGVATFGSTVGLLDTSAAHYVQIGATSSTTITADRALTLDVVNGARTLKLGANLTIATDPGGVTGALKANGAGSFTQAACADLSNGATGCSTATGTSGATLPLLNVANTWSGAQTFGEILGTVTTQSGTSYTLAAADCGTEVTFSNGSAVTVTIPATLPVGCNIAVLQVGAGTVSVNGSAVTAATLHSAHSYTGTAGQWAIIGINIEENAGGSSAIAILTGDGA